MPGARPSPLKVAPLVLMLLLAACEGDSERGAQTRGRTAEPAQTSATSPSPAPEASPQRGAPPDTLVAFQRLEGGDPLARLVVVETGTGRVARPLLDDVDTSEGGIFSPDLSADGRTLHYGFGTSACMSDVVRLRVDEGEEEVLAEGGAGGPALSPDGRLLAYPFWDPDRCLATEQSIVVRDLAAGTEARWGLRVKDGSGDGGVSLRRLAWLPDSRTLAYEIAQEGVASIYLLDTQGDQDIELGGGKALGPGGSSLELIGFHAEGLAAVWRCPAVPTPGCPQEPEIIALDPETGETVATLLGPAPQAVAYDLDPSGRHLLYVTEEGRLYRWSGGRPVKVGDGYLAATW